MNTSIYSKSVQNEINAINEQNKQETKQSAKKRINIELICAIATMLLIIGGTYLLYINRLIREFQKL